jgi:lipopolysaccharide/colanic/teichoic acid biosynthesis glycosyltransferase
LDEIPQLINILKGDMSLVGPRPETQEHINTIPKNYRDIILSIRPGATGPATLWNFREQEKLKNCTNPSEYYKREIQPKKIDLQIKYIKERTFLKDLRIITSTIIKILK